MLARLFALLAILAVAIAGNGKVGNILFDESDVAQ